MKLDIAIKFKSGYAAVTDKDTKAKKETNDCVVRAVMNAFEVSYNEAHKFCQSEFKRKSGKGCSGYGNMIQVVDGKIPALNSKTVKYIGSHPKAGGRETLRNPLYPIIEKSINDRGIEVKTQTFAGYTIGKFIQQHQKGTFFITVAGHALCVKDGVMLDNENHNDDLLNIQKRDQRRCKHIFQVK